MKIRTTAAYLLLVGIGLVSCQKSNNSSVIPSISFKSFTGAGTATTPTATLQLNFTDGDGDIGYPAQDASAPPNLWMKYLFCDTAGTRQFIGVYNISDSATNDSVYFVYHVPYITPAGKDKSLNGIIQIAMTNWFLNPYSKLDSLEVKFQIWIVDRAGHKSNVITTPVIRPVQYYGN